MKKYIISVLVVCLCAATAQAQVRLGARAGISTTGFSGSDLDEMLDKNSIGFYVGPGLEVLFGGHAGFDLSVLYSLQGINFRDQGIQRTGYIEIPLNIKGLIPVSENVNFLLGAGPYINFRVNGSQDFDVIVDGVSHQWKSESFGAGLNFQAGFEFHRFAQVGVNYGLGLTDNYSSGDFSARERVWSLYAAFWF